MGNFFIFVGRLTRDVELRYTKNEKAVIDLPLAVRSGSGDETLFVSVNVFGNLAENVSKYCSKGDLIGVCGIVKNNNYEDKDGNKHYEHSFIANKVTFLSTKKKVVIEEQKVDVPKNSKSEYNNNNIEISDEDLPF